MEKGECFLPKYVQKRPSRVYTRPVMITGSSLAAAKNSFWKLFVRGLVIANQCRHAAGTFLIIQLR